LTKSKYEASPALELSPPRWRAGGGAGGTLGRRQAAVFLLGVAGLGVAGPSEAGPGEAGPRKQGKNDGPQGHLLLNILTQSKCEASPVVKYHFL